MDLCSFLSAGAQKHQQGFAVNLTALFPAQSHLLLMKLGGNIPTEPVGNLLISLDSEKYIE